MIARILIITILSLLIYSPAKSEETCLQYQPTNNTLNGLIVRRTYPGRPNYEDINKGDEAEKIWVLQLVHSICLKEGNDVVNEAEKNISELQLVLDSEQYKTYSSLVDKNTKVYVTGTMFHAITAHHHTKVLLDVEKITSNQEGGE